MAMLSLPRFTIGFLVWFFMTTMVLKVQTNPQPISPPPITFQPQIHPKVVAFPSSLVVSSSLSSYSPGEILDSSNYKAKKKTKIMKKKQNKQGGTKEPLLQSMEKSSN